jgi:hypothetical protein
VFFPSLMPLAHLTTGAQNTTFPTTFSGQRDLQPSHLDDLGDALPHLFAADRAVVLVHALGQVAAERHRNHLRDPGAAQQVLVGAAHAMGGESLAEPHGQSRAGKSAPQGRAADDLPRAARKEQFRFLHRPRAQAIDMPAQKIEHLRRQLDVLVEPCLGALIDLLADRRGAAVEQHASLEQQIGRRSLPTQRAGMPPGSDA